MCNVYARRQYCIINSADSVSALHSKSYCKQSINRIVSVLATRQSRDHIDVNHADARHTDSWMYICNSSLSSVRSCGNS